VSARRQIRWRVGGALIAATAFLLAGVSPARAAARPEEQTDVLLRAMRDEAARSMAGLRIAGMEPPYFVEYFVEDRRDYKVTAVLGALEKQESGRQRRVRVGVRVGTRELDNTGFLSNSSYGYGGSSERLALEDDYDALRRELWLATDEAYKRALGQLAAKRAVLQNRTPDGLPDLSAEERTTLAAVATSESFDEAAWGGRVRALSAIYREFPEIQESGASLRVMRVTRSYVNSEGTTVRRPADMVLLLAGALTQAADGTPLYSVLPVFQGALAELPPQEQLAAAVRLAAERLKRVAAAPLAEKYTGPVLLAPQATAELFALMVLPALSGERPPLFDDQRLSSYFHAGAFSGRIGRRVLPEFLSLEDDPLRTALDGHALFGAYAVDDQGVPAQGVSLVEQGVLKTLLMSRRPGYGILQSNGHGRTSGGEPPRATPGNLILTAANGKSLETLKQDLIERCRKEGLGHGLVISSLGLPPAEELQSSLMSMMAGGAQGGLKLSAIVANLISVADGREQPVRGLLTADFTPRALLQIEAAGAERFVLNMLSADDGSVAGGVRSFAISNSDEQGAGTPVSVAAPALLFPELEFAPSEAPRQRLPLIAHPLAR